MEGRQREKQRTRREESSGSKTQKQTRGREPARQGKVVATVNASSQEKGHRRLVSHRLGSERREGRRGSEGRGGLKSGKEGTGKGK